MDNIILLLPVSLKVESESVNVNFVAAGFFDASLFVAPVSAVAQTITQLISKCITTTILYTC